MNTKYQIYLLVVILFFNACSKGGADNTNTPNGKCTLSNSYVVGKWQFEKVEIKQNGVYIDQTSLIEPCQKDDYFLFSSNGTYTRIDAGLACTFQNVENGTWSIINGQVYSNGIYHTVTILNCNKSIREFTGKYGEQYRYTMNRLP
jgi:hypothetical protein